MAKKNKQHSGGGDGGKSRLRTKSGRPVQSFDLKFTWYAGDWEEIFDKQIALIKEDVQRARAEDRLIIYLSCPISSRGGGYAGTNVDIARHVERALLEKWGEAFWILNPAQYQLESKAGTGLLDRHARELRIDLQALVKQGVPQGGDYMRMWTQVLVEDGGNNLGENFDAFYFLGPRDVHSFFSHDESMTLTAGIEAYFGRKFATDASFRDEFSVPGINWGAAPQPMPTTTAQVDPKGKWSQRRRDFIRFYSLRASANYSLGSHDEWAIFRLINAGRRKHDIGDQLASFFDGVQVDPASSEGGLSPGYAVSAE
jgi:hypothetical protein